MVIQMKVMEQVYRYPLFLVTVCSSVLSYMYEDHFGLFISQAQPYDISRAFCSLLLAASVHESSIIHLAVICFAYFVVNVMFQDWDVLNCSRTGAVCSVNTVKNSHIEAPHGSDLLPRRVRKWPHLICRDSCHLILKRKL